MAQESNLYLALLEVGERALHEQRPIKLPALIEGLQEADYRFETYFERLVFMMYAKYVFLAGDTMIDWTHLHLGTGEAFVTAVGAKADLFLTPERLQDLLDYPELEESRKSATQARWYALIAIGLTLVGLAISIILSLAVQRVEVVNPVAEHMPASVSSPATSAPTADVRPLR